MLHLVMRNCGNIGDFASAQYARGVNAQVRRAFSNLTTFDEGLYGRSELRMHNLLTDIVQNVGLAGAKLTLAFSMEGNAMNCCNSSIKTFFDSSFFVAQTGLCEKYVLSTAALW